MTIYRKALQLLKKKCAPNWPITVRRSKLPDDTDGDCQFKVDHFFIRINKNLTDGESVDALIHEFAHTHAWSDSLEMHNDEWGKAYSRIYRIVLKDLLDKSE